MHIAIVGAGPSGVFAAAAALERDDVSIDVYDRLPTPFGLVRYGVAPDHLKIKSVTRVLTKTMASDRVRFLGNVDYGRDIRPGGLHDAYDAVLFATGAAHGRHLGIPGEELPGNYVAADVVPWYNGHPWHGSEVDFDICHGPRSLAIIGGGNVSLDIARIILKGRNGLSDTDIPPDIHPALDMLDAVDEIHVVVRRSAADVRFTLPELQEFERMTGSEIDVLVAEADLALTQGGGTDQRLKLFEQWSQRNPRPDTRRLVFHFGVTPVAVHGDTRVEGLELRQTTCPTTETTVIPVRAVIQSIGYAGEPIPGIEFDATRCVIPNDSGRVGSRTYVAGWIKRGPTGVIGVNKACARETVQGLLADLSAEPPSHDRSAVREALVSQLLAAGAVDWQGWTRIDAAEISLGTRNSRSRTKIRDHRQLVAIATGA